MPRKKNDKPDVMQPGSAAPAEVARERLRMRLLGRLKRASAEVEQIKRRLAELERLPPVTPAPAEGAVA